MEVPWWAQLRLPEPCCSPKGQSIPPNTTRRKTLFYGYVVLFAGTIVKIGSGPGQSPVVGVFTTAIAEDAGLSAASVAALYFVATVGSALTLPGLGKAVDRFGPRLVTTVCASLLALACAGVWLFASASWVLLGICFYLLRLFGQGALLMFV
jgi:Na+/melibiose symporter-like transporter